MVIGKIEYAIKQRYVCFFALMLISDYSWLINCTQRERKAARLRKERKTEKRPEQKDGIESDCLIAEYPWYNYGYDQFD